MSDKTEVKDTIKIRCSTYSDDFDFFTWWINYRDKVGGWSKTNIQQAHNAIEDEIAKYKNKDKVRMKEIERRYCIVASELAYRQIRPLTKFEQRQELYEEMQEAWWEYEARHEDAGDRI